MAARTCLVRSGPRFRTLMSHPPPILRSMERQLILLNDDMADWRLDNDTRERGRRGVALARAALLAASRRTAA